jgi:hypothetical protein
MTTIEPLLSEREKQYGSFSDVSACSQAMKLVMKSTNGWKQLSNAQKESLEHVATKIARILNGDPNYVDSWNDIAGYAILAAMDINNNKGEY